MSLYVPLFEATPVLAAPGAAPAKLDALGVSYLSQRPQANWCWAACAVMVGKYFQVRDPDLGGGPTMCHLASIAHDNPNCCADPSQCDVGSWPDAVYRHLRISFDADVPSPPVNSDTALTPSQIRSEIAGRRPIEVLYRWSTQGSHVVLITGVYSDGQLQVYDPWFGVESPVTYDYVLKARGMGRWAGSYFGFGAAAPVAGASDKKQG
jgi:hypothetical protein